MIDPEGPDYTFTPVSPRRPTYGYAPAAGTGAPCVTVVTPFYNTGEIFHETARSLLGQSLQQWEWLIVNDASNDPFALSVLEAYRSCDARIRVVDLERNSGPSAARNLAFRLARTDYVALLDSDDLLEPTALEKWYWFLVSYPEFSFVKGFSIGFGALNYLWNLGFHTPHEFLRDNCIDPTSMVRRVVHARVGGYDEAARQGLEDWDFWLHCAHQGYWGHTIPEHLNWYRRRPNHNDRWPNWDYGEKQAAFRRILRQRYPHLWENGFPVGARREAQPNETVADSLPCENLLVKQNPRLLMIVPWLTTGGADKFNLDLVNQLIRRGWEITIATTVIGDNSWLAQFAARTPDIFILNNFLHLADQPRFLRYLISSRQIDVVMVTHSEMGYMLLPYLRAHFPQVTFVDYCHIVEEYWKNGGYPRMAVDYQDQLDRNIVASHSLKHWMEARGAEAGRISVCYISVDPKEWHPDAEQRDIVRCHLGLLDDTPVILFAGRILAQKQPSVLAKTISALRRRGVRSTTLVAGDGPDLEWLRSYVKKDNLGDQVRLLGMVSNRRMKDLMHAADILFLPSRWEGIALVIYEAMACGLPVVSANVGGQSELVTPECGVLIDLADESTQVHRYCDILEHFLAHPEIRRDMGQAGRRRVCAHFPLDSMGETMAALLAEARQDHDRQPRPLPSPGLARATAVQAVEYARLSQVADRLWAERQAGTWAVLPRKNSPWRAKIYTGLYRWHEPIYRWYSKWGFEWLTPPREWIKRRLLG